MPRLYTSALFQASNCFSLMVSFSSSGAMYLLVPTLLLNGMSTSSWSVSFTQRPRSAMTQVRSFFTRMFRDRHVPLGAHLVVERDVHLLLVRELHTEAKIG